MPILQAAIVTRLIWAPQKLWRVVKGLDFFIPAHHAGAYQRPVWPTSRRGQSSMWSSFTHLEPIWKHHSDPTFFITLSQHGRLLQLFFPYMLDFCINGGSRLLSGAGKLEFCYLRGEDKNQLLKKASLMLLQGHWNDNCSCLPRTTFSHP